ncbi:MAG: ABC transporter ATP-binding protein [Clostridia bacterium]|nr:ABC transporter ATP-binding protein [Clostridia bacterium]
MIMFGTNPLLTVLLISTSPFIAVFAYYLAKYIKLDFLKMRESNSHLNTVVAENISGNRVVKAYAREEYEIEKFEEKNEEYKSSFMGHVVTWAKYAPNMIFFVNLTSVIYIVVGGILTLKGEITIGEFTIFNGCLWSITSPMSSVGNFINQFQQFNASSLKIRQLENVKSLITNRDVKKRDTGLAGKIEFKNVIFSYDGDRVLKYINFSANPGDTIAIVGPTGSGKTTLVNLLSRFYDLNSGNITLDGHDIKHTTLKSLRSQMGIMLQDSFLFSGTIKDNIRYSKLDATDEEVIEAAKAVCAHDFIVSFPDGYDTMVTGGGSSLSAGQKQLIAFARALLADPAILILDEATSSIDTETEIMLQKGLERLLEGRTSFIIAHRLSTIKNSSRIMYIANKGIAESGTHEELLDKKGKYYELYMAQYKFLEQL